MLAGLAQRAASLIAQACAKSLTAKDRPRTRGRRPSSCPQSSRLSCWLSWPAAPRSRPFETSARAALHSSVPLAATAITHARRGRANGSVLYAPYTACAAPPTLRCARHTNSTSFSAPASCLPHLSLGPHLGSWQTKKTKLKKEEPHPERRLCPGRYEMLTHSPFSGGGAASACECLT